MTLYYIPIAEIAEVGLLASPFRLTDPTPGLHDRVWLDRDSLDRGRLLNRYTGDVEFLTETTGFGDGEFGNGIFGWS